MSENLITFECKFPHENKLSVDAATDLARLPRHILTLPSNGFSRNNNTAWVGNNHDEVLDVTVKINHGHLLGIPGALHQAETGRGNRHDHIPDLAVLIWKHFLDSAQPPISS